MFGDYNDFVEFCKNVFQKGVITTISDNAFIVENNITIMKCPDTGDLLRVKEMAIKNDKTRL